MWADRHGHRCTDRRDRIANAPAVPLLKGEPHRTSCETRRLIGRPDAQYRQTEICSSLLYNARRHSNAAGALNIYLGDPASPSYGAAAMALLR